MKTLFTAVLLAGSLTGILSGNANAQQDSIKRKDRSFSVSFRRGIHVTDTIKESEPKSGYFLGGLTFTRVDLGFSKLVDNGSFNLSPVNDFLDYRPGKTSTFSFDIFQYGYRFTPNFKMYVAGGFDWTHIRLENNITIQKNSSSLSLPYLQETIEFEKNRFSNSYVHVPLNFEFRSSENSRGKRAYLVVGPEIGFLLNGKIKQVSDERGKEKFKDSYEFQSFRYGGTIRLGYGGLGIFTKYYFNDMFTTQAQSGLRNMSFGLTFGLN